MEFVKVYATSFVKEHNFQPAIFVLLEYAYCLKSPLLISAVLTLSLLINNVAAPQADWVAIKRETSVDAKRMREREKMCFMVADMFAQQIGLPTAASDFKIA